MKLISPYASPERTRTINFEQFAFRAISSRSGAIIHGSRAPAVQFRPKSPTSTIGDYPRSRKQPTPATQKSLSKRVTPTPPSFNVNDEDWSRLRLCFSCGVKWSRHKTVNKKKEHIGKCIGSDSIAQVESLIRRTLEGAPPHRRHEPDGYPSQPLGTGTLLNDHVHAGEMRKNRNKNPAATISSVKDLVSAKVAIRKRAEEFLAAQAVPSDYPATQELPPSALGQPSLVPGSKQA